MSADVNDDEPGMLRVFQSKDETKAYYNKIAKVYDLLAEHSEQPMREKGLASLASQPGERILEIGFGTGHCLVEGRQARPDHESLRMDPQTLSKLDGLPADLRDAGH